jgi:hypothetical protein
MHAGIGEAPKNMREFEDSTLWRISAYERMRLERSSTAFAQLGENTVLPTTLVADLRQLEARRETSDALEVVAACLRHRQAALLCLRYEELVWPISLFPAEGLYHSPRDIAQAQPDRLQQAALLSCDAPGLRPPGHWMHERIGRAEHYRPLKALLWNLALFGPRGQLLGEIGGPAAYRALLSKEHRPSAPGAIGAAAERLRSESAALREIARWPGMSAERAARLLNALYLIGGLMVMRTHPAARPEADLLTRLLRFGRARR